MPFVAVCIGGALGSGLRYLVGLGAQRWLGLLLPWGTLAANLLGCFLLGFLAFSLDDARAEVRLALTTGAMGGFTTYSTFNLETLAMVEDGTWPKAFLYVLTTVIGGLVCGGLGIGAARLLR